MRESFNELQEDGGYFKFTERQNYFLRYRLADYDR